ncbi:hypothetical protein Pcinc_021354 [Petrolisthes cinctipes]|uniref:Uncharacterized protein n=1 Tax=Petrolisthes cinctipes TaxID=88211 RepID=A0AAE1FKA8_PETCI|nr:hypothetical protein Pcinc_021354 [Petrolisthes cinctipes]
MPEVTPFCTYLPTYLHRDCCLLLPYCVYAEQWSGRNSTKKYCTAKTLKYGREPGGSSCWSWIDLSLFSGRQHKTSITVELHHFEGG